MFRLSTVLVLVLGGVDLLVLLHLLIYSMYHNRLPPTGEEPGHYTTLGVISSQVARKFRRLRPSTGQRDLQVPSSTAFEPSCAQPLGPALRLLLLSQSSLPGTPALSPDSQLAMLLALVPFQPSRPDRTGMGRFQVMCHLEGGVTCRRETSSRQ